MKIWNCAKLFWGITFLSPKFPLVLGHTLVPTLPGHVRRVIVLAEQFAAELALLKARKFSAAGCAFRQHQPTKEVVCGAKIKSEK